MTPFEICTKITEPNFKSINLCNTSYIAVTLLYLQTVLFSATLPKLLVEFASAGLSDPTLVRLDVDAKIPETLKMGFFHCRPEVKDALLIHVLTSVIPQGQQVRHRTTSYVQLIP